MISKVFHALLTKCRENVADIKEKISKVKKDEAQYLTSMLEKVTSKLEKRQWLNFRNSLNLLLHMWTMNDQH